jgi:hypothetical protein
MNEKLRYVVFFGSCYGNIHHFFINYKEAKDYLINNEINNGRIAKLLAYTKPEFIELEKEGK